ncbi:class I SAM-dependent methyltransferase [Anabaena aphanizomenioides LEGE 00250]|uniref:Class I SAM-dependent methyltransferase n=1 Tax=Sphaerospermopsis aphanizomenoides LEGE 00250 TaxID=2777972 RepID=A0ABR9VGB2_9CYAN|nr:class I SAM-dependent methyltransferase [Sphaerospermopsis aphanizomenoides LEGE 00250]
MSAPFLRSEGICPICERESVFESPDPDLREKYKCIRCKSLPRERALIAVLTEMYPNWRDLQIHECSPGSVSADKLWRECKGYTPSAYVPSVARGQIIGDTGCRSEDLERQTFASGVFDIVVTQDVFEHLFDPCAAAREIMRTLKPGGAHIFTTPLTRKWETSQRRARKKYGAITHMLPPVFHVDPFNRGEGALVTIDWGYDIADILDRAIGSNTTIFQIDDITRGLRAQYNEVLVSRKGEAKFPRLWNLSHI